jgi:hypothetical protein
MGRPLDGRIEKNAEKQEKGVSTPIVGKTENTIQRRLEERQAFKAFRLTRDPGNAFAIAMGDGSVVQDKRPIASKQTDSNTSGMLSQADSLQAFIKSGEAPSTGETLVERLARRANVSPNDIIASNPDAGSRQVATDATAARAGDGKRDANDPASKWKDKAAEALKEQENHAMSVIESRINATVQEAKATADPNIAKHKNPIHVHSIFELGRLGQDVQTLNQAAAPGDTNQKIVTDLGIGSVPVADLKHSVGLTANADHALDQTRLDPNKYNCNDYIHMVVLSGDKTQLDNYIDKCSKNKLGSMTDTPEKFLGEHGYKPIEKGPFHAGDIIIIHGKGGAVHSAVVCEDPKSHALYTMQKPNSGDMPVRLSMSQLVQAEGVAQASVQVYRKPEK